MKPAPPFFSAPPLAGLILPALPLSPFAAGAAPEPASPPKIVAIKAGRLIDGLGGPPVRDAVILIQDDRITAVGPGLAIPAGAEIIDLSTKTVLPGLIDCHTHLTQQSGDYYEDLFRRSPIEKAIVAPVYARSTLQAG